MMPIAVTVSMRIATHSEISTSVSGMYSSATPRVAEPAANTPMPMAISSPGLCPTRRSTAPSIASIVPVARSTRMAPPTMSTKKMMSCASARPRGITVSSSQGIRVRASSISAYVPGTTTARPVSVSAVSNWPCGSSQVATRATTIMPNSSTRVSGTLKGRGIVARLPGRRGRGGARC
jgi:hypothetical protein